MSLVRAWSSSLVALLALLALLPLLVGTLSADPAASSAEDIAFFEKKVRPLLAENCYECHSERSEKRKGGLWLDRRDGWERGGDSGPALVPGDLQKSLLLHSVRYDDPDLEMPPEKKLAAHEIEILEEWVRRGAPDPRDGSASSNDGNFLSIEEGRKFWSFQPRRPIDPRSLDEIHEVSLASARIKKAPLASPEDRLRRLHLDLTGLPPSLEDQKRFLADPSTEAWAKITDELLATPAFGERWARHWLDIVRYSDSSGGGRALAFPDAWRFRDYVIDSFQADKPLDQLIREHLAGDLLPKTGDEKRDADQIIGTGFLVLGPNNYENQDKALLDLEIADEQADTMGRAFLGMTIGCARCHDHKFDPVPTSDYYALAGIFLSTHSVIHSNVSTWQKTNLPPDLAQAEAMEKYEKEVGAINIKISALKKQIAKYGGDLRKADGLKAVDPGLLEGIVIDDALAEKKGKWKDSTFTPRYVGVSYAHDDGQPKGEHSVTFRTKLPKAGKYEVRLAYSDGSNRSTKTPVTVISAGGKKALKQVNQKLRPDRGGLFHSLGSFDFEADTEAVVVVSNQGATDGVVIADAVQFLSADQVKKPAEAPTKEEEKRVAALRKELKAIEEARKKIKKPSLPQAMSVREGAKPADTTVRVRGNADQHGPVVPRGFLTVAMAPDQQLEIKEGSGRLQLAEWVVSPDNPLTARVLANRIWLKLTGAGIVTSPDNFGITGDAPNDPVLLDALANRLVAGEWSAKKLIREIVLSEAYQLASDHEDLAASKADPENRMFWKGRRRAADAETLRDSLLALGGNLDMASGGPSLPPGFKSEFGFNHKTKKRSVYVPIFRNSMLEIFSTFDFANPNFTVGRRGESTIPTQSLYLANHPFIHQQADAAAARLIEMSEGKTIEERIRMTYRLVLGREPSAEEASETLAFLREGQVDIEKPESWAPLYRALFASVDFRFLR